MEAARARAAFFSFLNSGIDLIATVQNATQMR